MLTVHLLRLDDELPLPAYAKPGDAGADLVSRHDLTIAPAGARELVPTGVAVAIPDGYAGLLLPRSGLALAHGLTLLNSPGLIDAGYRGELKVLMINTDPQQPAHIKRGERIAQLVIQKVEAAQFAVVDELPSSERGHGGFGHTGR